MFASGAVSAPFRKTARGLLVDGTTCNRDPVDLLRAIVKNELDKRSLVLLGEIHDNRHHHHARAHLVSLLGVRPGLVFEHIRADQQQQLDLFDELARNGSHLNSTTQLFRLLKWEESGWPDKAMFEPLFKAALKQHLPILPGDAPREKVRGVSKQGLAALEQSEVQRLKLDSPLAPAHQDALLAELEASHCGLMPKTAFASMALAQRYRDAHLASTLSEAAQKHGAAILFSGNGHARNDRGVPHYLRQYVPDRRVLTVQVVEVDADRTDPGSAVVRDAAGRPIADFTLFTPRVAREDPCIAMRAKFGKKP